MVGRTLRDKYARAFKAKNDAIAIIAKEYLQAQGIDGRMTLSSEEDESAISALLSEWTTVVASFAPPVADQPSTTSTALPGSESARFADRVPYQPPQQVQTARENLRVVVAIYDVISKAFRRQGNGII